ncbi:chromosome partitioning protein ParA [Alphaproteobacteria bacterium]|nr:chromosome partitioning protein ParA [Alphaproteobacteria bacterium]
MNAPVIIAIINQKGGVGKSTVSVNLSYSLSKKKYNVLMIDLDPQAHTSCIYCDSIGKAKTIEQAFLDKESDINELIIKATTRGKEIDNLYIIPSNIHLAVGIEQVAGRIYREKILKTHFDRLGEKFDFIIMDCPPTLGVLAINAIYAANNIVIPTNYSKYSLDGIADLLSTMKEIKGGDFMNYFILRNIYDRRNKQTNAYIDLQLESVKSKVLGTTIRKSESIGQAQISSAPVELYDPASHGCHDFELLVEELILNVA